MQQRRLWMRIRDLEAFALRAPLTGGAYWGAASWEQRRSDDASPAANSRFRPTYDQGCATTIVRVVADSGAVGYGESKAPVVPAVTRDVINDLLRPMLLGADPRDLVPIWDSLYGTMLLRGHSAGFLIEAIAGIDIALWDLIGHEVGQSISHLLGGRY